MGAVGAGELVEEQDVVAMGLGVDIAQGAGGVGAGDARGFRSEHGPVFQILRNGKAGAFLIILVMAFAAVVKRIVFAVEGEDAVDAAAVFVPSSVALGLENDALPFPVVEVGGGGQCGGAFAFAGVKYIQRIM